MSTQYDEKERLVWLKHMDRFGLNPFAFMGVIEDYIAKVHPYPLKVQWDIQRKDKLMLARNPKSYVELTIQAAGYHDNKKRGDVKKIDQTMLRLFMESYFLHAGPAPIDFQVMDAISVHLRTPGYSESDQKNPMREVAPWFKGD